MGKMTKAQKVRLEALAFQSKLGVVALTRKELAFLTKMYEKDIEAYGEVVARGSARAVKEHEDGFQGSD